MNRNTLLPFAFLTSAILILSGCRYTVSDAGNDISPGDFLVDTRMIPEDTLSWADVRSTRNGLIMYGDQKFSGYVRAAYPDKKTKSITSVYNGMLHGIFRSYYENGLAHEVRQYKNNSSTGKHAGFWPNGNKQFDYVYLQDRKVGYMNRWYPNGKPYLFLNYKDDKEEGLQQGWRENGKLFINYVAKDGHRYGLQETMLCYKLNEGNIIR